MLLGGKKKIIIKHKALNLAVVQIYFFLRLNRHVQMNMAISLE